MGENNGLEGKCAGTSLESIQQGQFCVSSSPPRGEGGNEEEGVREGGGSERGRGGRGDEEAEGDAEEEGFAMDGEVTV